MIPITRPFMDRLEEEAVISAIRSGWITQGPAVSRFEKQFAGAVGAPHACAVSNCTSALHLALLAVGVGQDDHVITASHSFIATANATGYCGAVPVFVDIERGTYNLDPAKLEDSVTSRTRAILCVHQMGMPCDMDAILDIASRRGLAVIEDAACAAGSRLLHEGRWEPVGRPATGQHEGAEAVMLIRLVGLMHALVCGLLFFVPMEKK
jgi:dTDP-4-amino-4,6-dideoxygalactose transaminase